MAAKAGADFGHLCRGSGGHQQRRHTRILKRSVRLRPGWPAGQGDPEFAALVKLAGDADDAAHQFDKLARDRQPEAGAAIAAVDIVLGLGEPVEDTVEMLGRYADA